MDNNFETIKKGKVDKNYRTEGVLQYVCMSKQYSAPESVGGTSPKK